MVFFRLQTYSFGDGAELTPIKPFHDKNHENNLARQQIL